MYLLRKINDAAKFRLAQNSKFCNFGSLSIYYSYHWYKIIEFRYKKFMRVWQWQWNKKELKRISWHRRPMTYISLSIFSSGRKFCAILFSIKGTVSSAYLIFMFKMMFWFQFCKLSSRNSEKRSGARTLPCRTPRLLWIQSVRSLFTEMAVTWFLYWLKAWCLCRQFSEL